MEIDQLAARLKSERIEAVAVGFLIPIAMHLMKTNVSANGLACAGSADDVNLSKALKVAGEIRRNMKRSPPSVAMLCAACHGALFAAIANTAGKTVGFGGSLADDAFRWWADKLLKQAVRFPDPAARKAVPLAGRIAAQC